MLVGLVYGYLPLAVIPLFVAFERIPDAIVEAGKDLGAGRWKTFFTVTLPNARAGAFTALILTFVPMTGEYVIPMLLGGGRGEMYGGLIHDQYFEAANYPLGSAMAVLLLVVLGVAIAVLGRLSRGFQEVRRVIAWLRGRAGGSWSERGLALFTVCVFVFLFAPIVTADPLRLQQGLHGPGQHQPGRLHDPELQGHLVPTARCARR